MLKCRYNPDQWFLALPIRGQKQRQEELVVERTRQAIDTCTMCPAQIACLEIGMLPENLHWGVWGGTLPAERLAKAGRWVDGIEERFMVLVHEIKQIAT